MRLAPLLAGGAEGETIASKRWVKRAIGLWYLLGIGRKLGVGRYLAA
jgi:hypothetical protein